MGFDTYWFDNNDDVSSFNFENCIFLTEAQVDQKIPLNKTSFYILHHCDLTKYLDAKCRHLNLCNYVNDCKLNKSFNYGTIGLEKINYFTYFDKKNNALYQPWATDIFPEDINFEKILELDEKKNVVYYIGSIWSENIEFINPFFAACKFNKKEFRNIRFITEQESRFYVENSYISPDIRGQHHIDVGYIPCRIFKNISYGCLPATNSKFISDFFGEDLIPFSNNTFELFKKNEESICGENYLELMKFLMKEVKDNHTYYTRVNTLLKFI
jgi:hypothetical protein